MRDFTVRKQILWESETATDKEVNMKEVELIKELQSNNPDIGYNQWSKIQEPLCRLAYNNALKSLTSFDGTG